jgi:hypothetical protein
MTQVIWALSQRGTPLSRRQGPQAGFCPYLAVPGVLDQPAALSAEEPTIGGHSEGDDVPAEQGDQVRGIGTVRTDFRGRCLSPRRW